jgi:hypothetical protein
LQCSKKKTIKSRRYAFLPVLNSPKKILAINAAVDPTNCRMKDCAEHPQGIGAIAPCGEGDPGQGGDNWKSGRIIILRGGKR